MKDLFLKGIIALSLVAFSSLTGAVDFGQYAQATSWEVDETTRATLIGIIDSCGTATSLNDGCVLENLERVSQEESNGTAQSLMALYDKALAEGNYNTIPECQTDTNLQVNRNIGHCVLLLNYHALKGSDKEEANNQYALCLQGAMLGLAYEGNLAAQLLLSQLFEERGSGTTGAFWRKALEQRKGTEEYDNVIRCYS